MYDSSARSNGLSLNDCLFAGPILSQNIVDIILRFRLHKIALVGDMEKAFLICLLMKRTEVLRFVWLDDIEKELPKLVVMRFTRVVFGVSSSLFLLNATIHHHMKQYESMDAPFVQKFAQSIYVDDVTFGADDEESVYELFVKAKNKLSDSGFNLRKCVSSYQCCKVESIIRNSFNHD